MSGADRFQLTDDERLALRDVDERHEFISSMRPEATRVFLRTREDRLEIAQRWRLLARIKVRLLGQEAGLLFAAAGELETDDLPALGRRLRRIAKVEYDLSLRAADALERGDIQCA